MKVGSTVYYECEKCHTFYESADLALECETRPITQDKNVKMDDMVRITRGDGAGSLAHITSVGVLSRDWGHHFWERYWHTVYITAKVIDDWGSRILTFDDYEAI